MLLCQFVLPPLLQVGSPLKQVLWATESRWKSMWKREKARERRYQVFRETPAQAGGCAWGSLLFAAHLPLAHGSCSCSIKSTPGWLLFARVPAPPLPFLLGDAGRGPLGQRQPHIMRWVEAAMCLAGRMTKGCRPLCGLCRSELLSSRAYLSRPFS